MPTDRLLDISRALACPLRLHVLRLLGDEGLCVSDVAASVGISVSTASVHLSRLVDVGLATRTRAGRRRIYAWPRRRMEIVIREDAPAEGRPRDP